MYLHMLPPHKKNVPDLLRDPVSLIQDVRTLIGLHRQDNRELAITGRPILTGNVHIFLHLTECFAFLFGILILCNYLLKWLLFNNPFF